MKTMLTSLALRQRSRDHGRAKVLHKECARDDHRIAGF